MIWCSVEWRCRQDQVLDPESAGRHFKVDCTPMEVFASITGFASVGIMLGLEVMQCDVFGTCDPSCPVVPA